MTEKQFRIVGIGEILWDIYGEQKFLGGAPANFAIHCAQLGDIGIVLSRVGKDQLGEDIKQALSRRNIDASFVQIDADKPTGTVEVELDEKGKPRFNCHTDVAFDYLQATSESKNLLQSADAILFGTLAQRNSSSREAIQTLVKSAKNTLKIYDINLRGWNDEIKKTALRSLQIADIVKLNDDEVAILKSNLAPKRSDVDFLKELVHKYNLKLAALTLGERGCILTDGVALARENGIKVTVKDTTGCGDAFAASLVHYFLRNASLSEIARQSNLVGAFVAQFKGATPIYTMSDVENFTLKINGQS
ncbi:MAG: carbohydrate kinase [Calditrichaeota bacterium]|nr:carbohydrate kinase [Calditrichota bacterium]